MLLKSWNVWTDEQFMIAVDNITLQAETVKEFTCDVLVNYCAEYSVEEAPVKNQTMDECLTQMSELPRLTDGLYADGDTFTCRALHSLIVKTNPDHCPHVTFQKEIDINGNYKCYESKLTTPETIFSQETLDFFKGMTLPYESDNPYLATHPIESCPEITIIDFEDGMDYIMKLLNLEMDPMVLGLVVMALNFVF